MITKAAVTAVNAVLAGQSALWCWYAQRPTAADVSDEHGLMEDLQVFAIAIGLFFVLARVGKAETRAERILFCGIALLFATFVILEYDTRQFGSATIIYLLNGRVRDLWLGGLWALAAIACLKEFHGVWTQFWRWLPTGAGWMLVAAGGFWMLGEVQDKLQLIGGDSEHFVEELVEVNASVLMLFSAWATLRQRSERRDADPLPIQSRSS